MKYSIETLLRGIKAVQEEAREKNQAHLEQNRDHLANYRNAARVAALHLAAVLKEEASRLERGYGDYKDGVTRDFWMNMSGRNPLGRELPYGSSINDLRERIQMGEDLTKEDLPPSELEVLLKHAQSLGETSVSFSFLTRSGHKPAYINAVAVAGAREEG